jgi:hypothetical protein
VAANLRNRISMQSTRSHVMKERASLFWGPCPHRGMKCCYIGSKFCKLYLNKLGFTLGEWAYLVKVFRVFRLKERFFGIQSVDTIGELS